MVPTFKINTCLFIRGFHIKMASVLGLTPLPLLDRLHNSLVKPILFSPLLQNLWSHLAVLAVPAGTSCLLHSLPLACTHFSHLYHDLAFPHPPRWFMTHTPPLPQAFSALYCNRKTKPPQGEVCLDNSRQPASRQLLHATTQTNGHRQRLLYDWHAPCTSEYPFRACPRLR